MNDRELMEQVEVVAWRTNRCEDSTFPRLHKSEADAHSLVAICNNGPRITKEPLMTVAQHKRIVSKLTDAAEALELLRAENAELELLADDACGKRCPDCGAPMVSLSTIDGGQRVCSGCNKTWDWHLKKGQQPLIGNNRMVNKV